MTGLAALGSTAQDGLSVLTSCPSPLSTGEVMVQSQCGILGSMKQLQSCNPEHRRPQPVHVRSMSMVLWAIFRTGVLQLPTLHQQEGTPSALEVTVTQLPPTLCIMSTVQTQAQPYKQLTWNLAPEGPPLQHHPIWNPQVIRGQGQLQCGISVNYILRRCTANGTALSLSMGRASRST